MRLIIAVQISPFDYAPKVTGTVIGLPECFWQAGIQPHVNIQMAYSAFQYSFFYFPTSISIMISSLSTLWPDFT
jgi:hypothetical protein